MYVQLYNCHAAHESDQLLYQNDYIRAVVYIISYRAYSHVQLLIEAKLIAYTYKLRCTTSSQAMHAYLPLTLHEAQIYIAIIVSISFSRLTGRLPLEEMALTYVELSVACCNLPEKTSEGVVVCGLLRKPTADGCWTKLSQTETVHKSSNPRVST